MLYDAPDSREFLNRPVRHRPLLSVLIALAIAAQAATVPARAANTEIAVGIAALPIVVLSALSDPHPERGGELVVAPGWFDVADRRKQAAQLGVEYRMGERFWRLRPQAGLALTGDGGAYGYLGLDLDADVGRHLILSTSFSAVGYARGDGKDLGGEGLGRAGIEVGWRFDDGMKLGLGFYHMSHAGVFGDYNPGTEIVSVTYAMPIDRLMTP